MSESVHPKMTKEKLAALLKVPPFHDFLRMEIVALNLDDQSLVMRLPFRKEYQRVADVPQLHGGPIAAFIDTVGAFMMLAATGQGAPTINLRIDYLRPTLETDLVAKAVIRRQGRTIALVDIDVTDNADRLIAVGRGSFGVSA